MNNLHTLRDQAKQQTRVDIQAFQAMTAVESLHTWAKLKNAYDWQLKHTAALFEQDHGDNLIALQARIHKLLE